MSQPLQSVYVVIDTWEGADYVYAATDWACAIKVAKQCVDAAEDVVCLTLGDASAENMRIEAYNRLDALPPEEDAAVTYLDLDGILNIRKCTLEC